MLKEKVKQASFILEEKGIDLWLTFVRETSNTPDPALDLIYGGSCTWQTAFIITASGDTVVIAGSLDVEGIKSKGLYDEVIGYVDSIKDDLVKVLKKYNPQKIAINTSKGDVMSDGLSHGMYELLVEYLEGTDFAKRLVSSEEIISALRGRKSPAEQELVAEAVKLTEDIYKRVGSFLKPGLTEKEVAQFILEQVKKEGVETAWGQDYCPSVFTGPESAGAHAGPTDRKIEPGHVLNIDFGVKKNGFCSDIQRTWYFLRDGEEDAPQQVKDAFDTIRDAIQLSAKSILPGIEGCKIDDVARNHITGKGYEEYPHALGHQVGRSTHDGAGLLCPRWERYRNLPYLEIEIGQVYTLEPRITLKDYGVLTMEEIIVVGKNGARFLSRPQTELYLVKQC
ncbi:MAG: Xaa-Pro peptidase family protein [Candidatus Margulisiibacteriota bacterium]